MPILKASTELVGVAWIAGVNGINSSMVGTTVPRDNETWAASGFLQVTSVGGARQPHIPVVEPAVRVHAWAFNKNSTRPPWGKASNLMELLCAGTYADNAIRTVDLPGDFPSARVISTYVIGEPQRVPDDEGSYAHYYADLQMHWVEAA